MKRSVYLLLFACVLAANHCKRSEPSSQPRGFESPGLRFTYPGHFKITGQSLEADSEQITLEAEQNLLIIITAFRQPSWERLEDFAETIATEQVITLSQAIRREVASMGDGIERALARASELETLVRSEVATLERSYADNERRIRTLIDDLSNEREAIVAWLRDPENTVHTGAAMAAYIERGEHLAGDDE